MLSSVDGKIDALAEFLVLSGVVFKEGSYPVASIRIESPPVYESFIQLSLKLL
jgi:hypothetical protein